MGQVYNRHKQTRIPKCLYFSVIYNCRQSCRRVTKIRLTLGIGPPYNGVVFCLWWPAKSPAKEGEMGDTVMPTITRGDDLNVLTLDSRLSLTLHVADTEVITELAKQGDELNREQYALVALRLGVLTLRQARGELDSAAVRQAGQEVLNNLGELLTARGGEITSGIAGALRQYFDPRTGTLPQRIESLIRNDGDLERVLRSYLAPENSTIARALAAQVGEGSPIFKLLSPDHAEGLKARIESMLVDVLTEQQQQIVKEFSLDDEGSALSRLVKRVQETNGTLTEEVTARVEGLIGEFSLDRPDSALSRLVRKVEVAQEFIGNSLTLDDDGSSLSRLKRELQATIDGLAKSNSEFHTEVREVLARLESRRETSHRSTLHGNTFQEQVDGLLDSEARRFNDLHENTSASVGIISHCKVGDFVTTLGPDSAAPRSRIVWEAKSDKSYDLKSALVELQEARKNRKAQVGVFVFSRESAPSGLEPFSRYGSSLVVLWDPADPSTDLHVKVAFSVARALVVREAHESAESDQALRAIEVSTRVIEKQLEYLAQIKTWAETVKSNGEKIADRSGRMHEALLKAVEELDQQLLALKTSEGEA